MNTILKYLATALVIINLSGCYENTPKIRYQLIAAKDQVYRLDLFNGRVSKVDISGVEDLNDNPTQLIIGNTYNFEDGKTMKYIGNGKFDSAITVIKW